MLTKNIFMIDKTGYSQWIRVMIKKPVWGKFSFLQPRILNFLSADSLIYPGINFLNYKSVFFTSQEIIFIFTWFLCHKNNITREYTVKHYQRGWNLLQKPYQGLLSYEQKYICYFLYYFHDPKIRGMFKDSY